MSKREPIFNWPVVAALLVVGGLIWLLKSVINAGMLGAFDQWGWLGFVGALAAGMAIILTIAYLVDRRADNLPRWLPRWLQRSGRR
jgi:hypothetical protein